MHVLVNTYNPWQNAIAKWRKVICFQKNNYCGIYIIIVAYAHVSIMHALHVLACTSSLTQVGTEGNFSSSSWYGTAVGPGWTQGIVRLSTSQSDQLWSIPHNVELLTNSR